MYVLGSIYLKVPVVILAAGRKWLVEKNRVAGVDEDRWGTVRDRFLKREEDARMVFSEVAACIREKPSVRLEMMVENRMGRCFQGSITYQQAERSDIYIPGVIVLNCQRWKNHETQ